MTLRSVWQDLHPGHLGDETFPDVAVEGHHDVVVIGGGITGLTTALELGRTGAVVLLVEARSLGSGTTGRTTAKVSLLQGTQLGRIARLHADETVEQYVAANAEAQGWLAAHCADHGVERQIRPACTYATTKQGAASVHREAETAERAGLPVTCTDEADLPFPTTGAVWLPDQYQVDPLELVESLTAEARRHGVQIVEGARVRSVRGHAPHHVVTTAGTTSADAVVLATNLPFLDRGGWFARFRPARSYGLAFATPSPAVAGMYLSADQPSRSLRDGGDADAPVLLVGGEGHTTGRGGSTVERLDSLRVWTAEHFPDAVETHAWSAQDYSPAHALPVAGPLLPGHDTLLVAGGFSKWGMTNGVAAALALVGRLSGQRRDWDAFLAPWSGRELPGLPGSAVANGEVALEMGRGWIRPVTGTLTSPSPDEGEGVVRFEGVGTPTAQCRVDGIEHRTSGVCPHLGGIVRWNDAEASWDCPLHGSRFAPDGSVLEGPATRGLAAR